MRQASKISFVLICFIMSARASTSFFYVENPNNNCCCYPRGPRGPRGITGCQGPQGIQGFKGDQGPAGPQGIQGVKGDKGETGPQGLQGLKGDQGPEGTQGIQGPIGDQGPAGPQGLQGLKGDQGPEGSQGIQGVKGDRGDKGETGSPGIWYECATLLYQTDFQSDGYTISEPGKYVLCENIASNNLNLQSYALRIDSDNVFLDLNNRTLSSSKGGIIVESNHHDITIANGIIESGSTHAGISCSSNNRVQLNHLFFNSGAYGVLFDLCQSIALDYCTFMGITDQCLSFDRVSNGTIDDCKFYDCHTANSLLELSDSNSLSFSYIFMSNCSSNQGITINSCNSIKHAECSISQNNIDSSAINIQESTDITIQESSVENNTFGNSVDVNIINLEKTENFVVKDIKMIGNSGAASNFIVIRAHGDTGLNDVKKGIITRCVCFNNVNQAIDNATTIGILIQDSDSVYITYNEIINLVGNYVLNGVRFQNAHGCLALKNIIELTFPELASCFHAGIAIYSGRLFVNNNKIIIKNFDYQPQGTVDAAGIWTSGNDLSKQWTITGNIVESYYKPTHFLPYRNVNYIEIDRQGSTLTPYYANNNIYINGNT